jgi:hypothetical protein
VKASGIVIALVVLVLAAIMLVSGGDHGPSRHAPGHQSTGHLEQKSTENNNDASQDPSAWGSG